MNLRFILNVKRGRKKLRLFFDVKSEIYVLKTASAFANYGDGEINFGVKDDGTVVGVKDPVQTCLNIENKINDSIRPQVDYRFQY